MFCVHLREVYSAAHFKWYICLLRSFVTGMVKFPVFVIEFMWIISDYLSVGYQKPLVLFIIYLSFWSVRTCLTNFSVPMWGLYLWLLYLPDVLTFLSLYSDLLSFIIFGIKSVCLAVPAFFCFPIAWKSLTLKSLPWASVYL